MCPRPTDAPAMSSSMAWPFPDSCCATEIINTCESYAFLHSYGDVTLQVAGSKNIGVGLITGNVMHSGRFTCTTTSLVRYCGNNSHFPSPVPLQTPSSKKTAEPIRLDLARSLNTWERQKEHFFLSAFIQVTEAFSRFYEGGLDIMQGMESFLEDIKEARRQALSREVWFPITPTSCMGSAMKDSLICRPCFSIVSLGHFRMMQQSI